MIETERLVLRKPRLEDADGVREYASDPEVMRFLGGAPEGDLDAREVIERWLARWEANGVGHFAVERREDGRFLGRVGVIVWDTRDWQVSTFGDAAEHAQPELGWALARAHWGSGYATEAALAVRDWADCERLISLIHPDNGPSNRVAKRLGATPTETVTVKEKPAVIWVHPR